MKYKQLNIFKHTEAGSAMRMSQHEAHELSISSVNHYGKDCDTWVIGFSGGKDSTALVTFLDYQIQQGTIAKPENLIVAYSDTLMELPSLEDSANNLLNYLKNRGWRVFRSEPNMGTEKKSERFFVNLLGRGYPPPTGQFRWCTDRMKNKKITNIYKTIAEEYNTSILGMDGIRKGESAARDQRILASCSTDDGECGQGWFHKHSSTLTDTLSPVLHWRLCHVWDWLFIADLEYGYPITGVSETYGVNIDDDFEDLSGRTGCIGCPLVTAGNQSKPKPDKALNTVLLSDRWSHLQPYQELSDVYWRLRWDESTRHKKLNGNKGCLTIESRKWALEKILEMQEKSIRLALSQGRKPYKLIQDDEVAMIQEMLKNRVFPLPRGYAEGELV